MDPIAKMKEAAREGWSTFAPFETMTGSVAPMLVKFAGVNQGDCVLDVACGTGVVALSMARVGAEVTGLDLTPALLGRAAENAALAGVTIEFREGDVENLPFDDVSFDRVVSQFGHMFGPRPAITVSEMLRVLKPGGIIAFSTWPPEFYIGLMFKLIGRYAPPPPEGVPSPTAWGDPNIVRQRLGDAVTDLAFDSGTLSFPALSPAHVRLFMEANAGPVSRLVESLADDADRLTRFRAEFESLVSNYFDNNALRQDFLMSRARKV
ncbi:MAG: class I SAM-dependent methyltransferase [Gammaproteobacteria bacterium]|nr:class I SAM-dependent methyltransferase [Gammaproteobacteria bacterium]